MNRYWTQPLFFTYFENAAQDAEFLQDELNLVVERNAKDIVVKELIHSLQKLRDKEKEKRQKKENYSNTTNNTKEKKILTRY